MRPDQIDAYRTELEAAVVRVAAEGDNAWVSLSESVFYPTAGGQEHDTGTLSHAGGVAEVIDVVADGPDAVRHRVRGPLPSAGERVSAAIHWPRRYRHMQRHSAQHLLSQAFLRVSPAFETRSVSLTSQDVTIDFAGEPDAAAVAAAFETARAWAYAALPIESFEIDEADVGAFPLRRPPKVSGRIRLVRMGDVELSACGGTHLRSTAEMLPLLPLRRQRIRGGLTRVTFRAGHEAGELAARTLSIADDLARSFSSQVEELPDRVDGLREELRSAHRAGADAVARWAHLRARQALTEAGEAEEHAGTTEAAASGSRWAAGRPLLRIVTDGAGSLQPLADACAEVAPAGIALLAAREDGRATLLFRCAPDAAGAGAAEAGDMAGGAATSNDAPLERAPLDLRPFLRAALPHVNGRGGGRPDRVQGSGDRPEGIGAALDAAAGAVQSPLDRRP